MVGCGLKGKFVRRLSFGMIRTTNITDTINSTSITITTVATLAHHTCHIEPHRNQSIVRRVAAGLAAAVLDKVAKKAAELSRKRGRGQYDAAKVELQRAIDFGDLARRGCSLVICGRSLMKFQANRNRREALSWRRRARA